MIVSLGGYVCTSQIATDHWCFWFLIAKKFLENSKKIDVFISRISSVVSVLFTFYCFSKFLFTCFWSVRESVFVSRFIVFSLFFFFSIFFFCFELNFQIVAINVVAPGKVFFYFLWFALLTLYCFFLHLYFVVVFFLF